MRHGEERVNRYLKENDDLRHALDIAEDVKLVARPLGKGEHNENYLFTEPDTSRAFVLRVNVLPQPFHDNQVAYEFAALKELEPSGCTPKPLYLDDSDELFEHGALVESFCEGEQLDFDHLRDGDLRCAAQLMANLHAIEPSPGCPLHRPVDPLKDLYKECLGRFDYYLHSGFEDARVTAWMQRYIEAVQPALETNCDAADLSHIVNTETLASHFLIPHASAKEAASHAGVSGTFCRHPGCFVDWERPIIGEVAQDLAFFVSPATTFWDSEYLFPRENIEVFLHDYWQAVDDRFAKGTFETRFWAYFKMSLFRSAMFCCKALARYAEGGHGYTTEKTKGKLPIYLSDEFNEMLLRDYF